MAEMAKTGVSLPISSYRGPDVNLPWTVPNLPVDLQLEDVASRLYQAQEERKAVEEQVGSGKYPLSIARQKRSSGASSSLIAGNAQRLLRVQQDPRLLEMQEALSSDPSSEYPSETKAVWLVHFRQGLRKLIDSVAMSPNPDAAERQLDEAYRWYQKARRPAHHALTSCTAGPGFHDFCADEVLRHPAPPGSAFFVPEALDRERPGRSASHDSTKFEALSASLPTVAGRHAVQVKLASPRERLKEFNTRQLVRPLTARKLKDLEHRAEADQDRPLTPSTTCGGLTARSMVSARSPTPAHAAASRPTSAMSIGQTTTSGRAVTPRSFDRRRRPQSAASNTSTVAGLPQTLEEEIALQLDDDYHMLPYPATEAEHRMEKRWLSKRNRAITDKVVGEEQRTAVRDWAERRAHVEEEISRNAEASRFQCALDRRRYCEPADALEDIDATVADDEVEGHVVQRVASQHRRPSEPVRVDVSQPKGYSFQVSARFAEEKKPKALNSRIAHLRRIHAHLIEDERPKSDEENEDEGEAEEAHAQSATPVMLSPYAAQDDDRAAVPRMEDDSDVLVGICDWWGTLHPPIIPPPDGTGVTLDEIRFQQLQEVEEIKRVCARRSYPVNVGVLERALVMPAHKLNPGHLNGIYIVNTSPDLLSNPFLAKKKKIKKKKKLGKGKKSRSTSAKKGKGK